MNILATICLILAYVLGPIYIGWVVTYPKAQITPELSGINIFYVGGFIFFFGVGVLLRYHLGVK